MMRALTCRRKTSSVVLFTPMMTIRSSRSGFSWHCSSPEQMEGQGFVHEWECSLSRSPAAMCKAACLFRGGQQSGHLSANNRGRSRSTDEALRHNIRPCSRNCDLLGSRSSTWERGSHWTRSVWGEEERTAGRELQVPQTAAAAAKPEPCTDLSVRTDATGKESGRKSTFC